ncbi:TonB-dependent receptor [Limibacter armeniacum]|uniref:TonB-dependent receptor n=1 Tax=Limibacter armeniacum TaxID=466084 RepID=UPI002FE52E92
MKKLFYAIFLMILAGVMGGEALAQGTAKVVGLVKDASGTLPGVSVVIKGTSNGDVTDVNGKFMIKGLAAGAYTLNMSYVGYEATELNFSIKDGETLTLDPISLSEDSEQLEEVLVRGTYMPSQMRALSIQKQSLAIQNILAADGIGKLPDRNAAEAVQRVQGVSIERDQGEGRFAIVRGTPISWNATLLNGDRMPSSDFMNGGRGTALDIIPSELIEYVSVTKALTPDMEGDVIGGAINFQTRTAPYERMLNVSAAGGYNAQAADGSYNASIIYGDRFFNDKLGVIASAAIWDRKWASDNYEMEYNYEKEGAQSYSINNMQLRDYNGSRKTIGLNLGTEYNINVNNKVFFKGLINKFNDNEYVNQHNFYFPDPESGSTGEAQVMTREAAFVTELYGGEFGGEHELSSNWKMDWKLSTYKSDFYNAIPENLPKDERGLPIIMFTQSAQYNELGSDGYKYWDFDSPNSVGGSGDVFLPEMQGTFDADEQIMDMIYFYGMNATEEDRNAQLNFEVTPSDRLKVKFGGKYKNKERVSSTVMNIYLSLGSLLGIEEMQLPMSNYALNELDTKGGLLQELGSPYENYLIPQITSEEILNIYELAKSEEGQGLFFNASDPTQNSLTAINATEDVYAGYAMAEWNISNALTFVGGARLEVTDITMEGAQLSTNEEGEVAMTPISSHSNYAKLLPMAHLKYEMNKNVNLRAAYTRSLARPSFSDLNPSETVSSLDGIREMSKGNTELAPTISDNFDVMAEYYLDDVGLISGGAFYKNISNVIFTNVRQDVIDGQTTRLTQPENLKNAFLLGVEAGISKRLTFLPGFLSGFGVNANYTFTKSEVEVPSYDAETLEEVINVQPLRKQPKHIFNAALFYEKYGLTARLAANYKGSYVDEYRIEAGPEHYRWYDKNLTLDFNATYTISDHFRVFAEVNNLTNEPLRYYHGDTSRPEQVEYYSIKGQMGIRFSL